MSGRGKGAAAAAKNRIFGWGEDPEAAAAAKKLLTEIPNKLTFLRQSREEQLATLIRIAGGAGLSFSSLFISYLAEVDILTLCAGKTVAETFLPVMLNHESFLRRFIEYFFLNILPEELATLIQQNATQSFEIFLQALDRATKRTAIKVSASTAMSSIEREIIVSIQADPRHNVLRCLYEKKLSVSSWLALGWEMYDNATVFCNPGRQCTFVIDPPLARLYPISLEAFNIVIRNTQSGQTCNTQRWFTEFRQDILYLPLDFPIPILCAAIRHHYLAVPEGERSVQAVFSPSMDELYQFRSEQHGFDVQSYLQSVAYTGPVEACLLFIKPTQAQDPVFYTSVLKSGCSVIILSQQSDPALRALEQVQKGLCQYYFAGYSKSCAQALLANAASSYNLAGLQKTLQNNPAYSWILPILAAAPQSTLTAAEVELLLDFFINHPEYRVYIPENLRTQYYEKLESQGSAAAAAQDESDDDDKSVTAAAAASTAKFFHFPKDFPAELQKVTGLIGCRITDNGDCQFEAVAQQLLQIYQGRLPDKLVSKFSPSIDFSPAQSKLAQALRELAVAYIAQHPGTFRPYIPDLSTYLRKMKNPGAWGDENTLAALAKALGLAIFVLHKDDLIPAKKADPSCRVYRPDEAAATELDIKQLIVVLYNGGTHYNAIVNRPGDQFSKFLTADGVPISSLDSKPADPRFK